MGRTKEMSSDFIKAYEMEKMRKTSLKEQDWRIQKEKGGHTVKGASKSKPLET